VAARKIVVRYMGKTRLDEGDEALADPSFCSCALPLAHQVPGRW